MATIEELAKQIADLRAQIAGGSPEIRRAQRSITKTLVEKERAADLARLRPRTSLVGWDPREGEAADVPVSGGLIARLKAGDPVSASMGNSEPLPPGAFNRLRDPAMESFGLGATWVLTTSWQSIGTGWGARYVLNSGSAPTIIQLGGQYSRTATPHCPLRTNVVRAEVASTAGDGAFDIDIEIVNTMPLQTSTPNGGLPYFVAGVSGYIAQLEHETVTFNPEIVDSSYVTEAAADACSSTEWVKRSIYLEEEAAYHHWLFRVNVVMVATGTAHTSRVFLGEPQFHRAPTIDLPPFEPAIGRWDPIDWGNIDGGAPDSNYGGISPIDCGGV